ncbi:MAG: TonB family protein [Burkholderiaceae bacterium]
MTRAFEYRLSRCVLTMTLVLAACGSPAPAPPKTSGPTPAPIVTPPAQIVDVAPAASASPSPSKLRLAARDPVLDDWKRVAAEKVYAVNRARLFDGRPEHLLRAVIVVEATVDREGKVTRSKILRSPGIASLNDVALTSLKAASPLPAPPAKLVARGPLVFSETWLFRKDGRFQLRTLALAQE